MKFFHWKNIGYKANPVQIKNSLKVYFPIFNCLFFQTDLFLSDFK